MGMNRRVWGRPGSGFPVSVKGGAALLSGCWQFIRKEVNIMKVYCWDAIQFCNYSEQKGQRSKIQIARLSLKFSSVQSLSCVQLFATSWTAARQASLSITNSRSLPKLMFISSSVVPCSSCLQSFPASGSFQMSQLFASGGQSVGVLTLASVLPMNIQYWFPLGWTGWISLQSKGLSKVFSNTTVQKQQFFSSQISLQSNAHIHTWLLEKP